MKQRKENIRDSFSEERRKIKEVFCKLTYDQRKEIRANFDKKFGKHRLYGIFAKNSPYALHESHLRFFAENMFSCSLADIMEADFNFVPAVVSVVKKRKTNVMQPKITQHSQASLFILAKKDNEKKRGKTTVSAEVQRD